MLRVSIDTRIGVEKVLKRTQLLPDMDKKIDEVLERVVVIDEKIDRILAYEEKRSQQDYIQESQLRLLSRMNILKSKLAMEEQPFAYGGTCEVFRATYYGQTVAAKVQSLEGLGIHKIKQVLSVFEKELVIVCQLSHPNIMRVYGACTEQASSLILVCEYAQVLLSLNIDDAIKFFPDHT
jgi:hypothetical protein